jgi:hypothetical protein
MSNYVGEAAAYSAKVSKLKGIVSQVTSSLSAQAAKLGDVPESTLKSNVNSSINAIKSKLESIVSSAQANASKLATKAAELDAENNKSTVSTTLNRTTATNIGDTEDNEEKLEKGLDVRLDGEKDNRPQVAKAIDIHLGETPGANLNSGTKPQKLVGLNGGSPYV